MGLRLVETQRYRRQLLPGHVPRDERDGLLRETELPSRRVRGLCQAVKDAAWLGFQSCLLQGSSAQQVGTDAALAERVDIQRFDPQSWLREHDTVVGRAMFDCPARLVLPIRRRAQRRDHHGKSNEGQLHTRLLFSKGGLED